MRKIRVGVTGGRDYFNQKVVWTSLDQTHNSIKKLGKEMFLVVGDATGADNLALQWAKTRGVEYKKFDANWNQYKKAAGPIRNKEMLKSGLDKLCAFPGNNGTADMTNQCRAANVYIREYK